MTLCVIPYAKALQSTADGVLFGPQVHMIRLPLKDFGTSSTANHFAHVAVWRGQLSCSEKYQRFAAECLRLSRVVTDSETKVIFVQMAAMFLRLAERAKAQSEKEAA